MIDTDETDNWDMVGIVDTNKVDNLSIIDRVNETDNKTDVIYGVSNNHDW